MSAPAIETTMPAHAAPAIEQAPPTRSGTPRSGLRTGCTVSLAKPPAKTAPDGTGDPGDLAARLAAAHQRTAELEERLAATIAALDAAEHRAAQLEDRNRELASDLDNALDQLAGHALHCEQERLVRAPAWYEQPASNDRGGFRR